MLVALLIPCIASAAPFFERLQTELREDPRATSASLRRPDGPLATAWPETRGDLEGAPVYVVDVDVQSTFLRFDLVASWTNPSAEPVGSLQLRWPAEALGAYAPLYSVEGGTARVDKDLLWLDLDAPLAPGDTAVVRLRGAVHPGSFTERQWRLGQVADGYIAAAWLPHFAHHDGKRWDPVPMAPVGDPTAPIAGVFLARLIPSDERPLQLVHPGVRLVDDGEQVVLAAVGARELSLGVLGASWQAVTTDDVRLWFRGASPTPEWRAQTLQTYRDRMTEWMGPLSFGRLEAIASAETGRGTELSGMVLLPADNISCLVDAHEVAHMWWYGEAGTAAVAEPWLDETLTTWFTTRLCPSYRDGLYDWAVKQEQVAIDRSAHDLGEDWTRLYTHGPWFWDALDRPELDRFLRGVIRENRWKIVDGGVVRKQLEERMGAGPVNTAWENWMKGNWETSP